MCVSDWSANALASSIKSAPFAGARHRSTAGTTLLANRIATHSSTPPDVLSPRMARAIEGLAGDWRWLDQRIEELSNEIEELARRDPACVRLMSVPGIGPIISSAWSLRSARRRVFQGARLRRLARARAQADLHWRSHHSRQHIEAWQSLSARPIRASSLGHACEGEPEQMARPRAQAWIEAAKKRLHHNVLAIALANKLARIAWSVLARGRGFEANKLQAA